MRDRPSKPIGDAIFWVEYTVRHKGDKNLRVTYIDLPLYGAYVLDILRLPYVRLVIIS